MNSEQASRIILYVVEKTEPRWREFDEHWGNINRLLLSRGYEQGGFLAGDFVKILDFRGVSSIEKIGGILDNYKGKTSYNREFAGSLEKPFYQDTKNGVYGEEGKEFFKSVQEFRGKHGAWFWSKVWQMLVCCNYLKNNYRGSYSYFLKRKYAGFKKMPDTSDAEFLSISSQDWESFKIAKNPWKELCGIGVNVFDYIVADITEAEFVKESYKFDSANQYFFRVTSIEKIVENINRENVIDFLKQLNLPYALREINKGIYTYCSVSEAKNFGFCRDRITCEKCGVNDICEKNIDAVRR